MEVTVGVIYLVNPGNVEDSSLPIEPVSCRVINTCDNRVTTSLAGNIPNFIGDDGMVTLHNSFSVSGLSKSARKAPSTGF